MYKIQQRFTFEWVTDSVHDTWDEAEDRFQEIMDSGQTLYDVRVVPETAQMPRVNLVKEFGVHALSWMRPINRENKAVRRLDGYLRQWNGPLAAQTRDDLNKNDLRGLSTFLYLAMNDPYIGE